MENKICKKCGKELPINYKGKYCEHCTAVRAENTKKGLLAVLAFAALAVPAALTVANKKRLK